MSVMYAMEEGLRLMKAEGRENVYARHARVAQHCRAGVQALASQFLDVLDGPEADRWSYKLWLIGERFRDLGE